MNNENEFRIGAFFVTAGLLLFFIGYCAFSATIISGMAAPTILVIISASSCIYGLYWLIKYSFFDDNENLGNNHNATINIAHSNPLLTVNHNLHNRNIHNNGNIKSNENIESSADLNI